MTTDIISIPGKADVSGASKEYGFGYCEALGGRATQEDALAWHMIKDKLHPSDSETTLTPTEIAHRLWTSYQVIDKEICAQDHTSGSTAATTVYDGKGNLVTALLADAAAFAAVYNKKGEAIAVVRLNSITHKPTDEKEYARIKAAGGFLHQGRIFGELAVSRAIGDKDYKTDAHPVTSEATIDITSIEKIKADLIKANPKINMEDIGNIQVITTCDGYTDMAKGGQKSTKKQQEEHLLSQLQSIGVAGVTVSEEELSKYLVEASRNGNRDNISVCVQTITDKTPAFFTGVYDGHGGDKAAIHIAQNIGKIFLQQCALSKDAYAAQELSVDKKRGIYDRDHQHQLIGAVIAAAPLKPEPVAQAVTTACSAPLDSAPKKPDQLKVEKPSTSERIRILVLQAAAKSAPAPTPAVDEPTPPKQQTPKSSIVPLVGNEADKEEIERIKKVLNDFKVRRTDPTLSKKSTKKALDQLKELQKSLDRACEDYERGLGLKAKDYKLISPETRDFEENNFKEKCMNSLKASLSNGLADDLNWKEYLFNLVKCLCNVIISKVSGNTNQFFSYEKSSLEMDVDDHIDKLTNKGSDQRNKT